LSESRRVVCHDKKKICRKEHGLGFKNSLLYIGIDFFERLRIKEALSKKGKPLLLHFDDSITGQAGTRIACPCLQTKSFMKTGYLLDQGRQ
jgi:hypothetical protein